MKATARAAGGDIIDFGMGNPDSPDFKHFGPLEVSKLLPREARVAVAPGLSFGEYGDDYVRIGLVENIHRIRRAVRNIKSFLKEGGHNIPPAKGKTINE